MGTRTLRGDRKLSQRSSFAAVVLLTAQLAAAQGASGPRSDGGPSLVVLRTPGCALPSPEFDRFVQLLAIELAIGRVQLVRDAPIPGAELALEMDGAVCTLRAAEFGIAIARPSGVRTVHSIALQDVQESARPRALALAVAELVRGARSIDVAPNEARPRESMDGGELGATTTSREDRPRAASPPAPPSSPFPGAAASIENARTWQGDVNASFASRLFAPEATPGFGAALGSGRRLSPAWLYARAGITATWASIDDRLGTVALSTYGAGLSVVATTGRFPELSIGPHLQVGVVRAAGSAGDASTQGTVQMHPMALVSLTTSARFWIDRWAPFVEIDAGAALASADIYADDRRVAAVSGAFLGVRAGVAFGY